jgi:hypothetical protein
VSLESFALIALRLPTLPNYHTNPFTANGQLYLSIFCMSDSTTTPARRWPEVWCMAEKMEEQNCSIVVSRYLIALWVVIWSSEKHELHIWKALQTQWFRENFPHYYFRLYFAEIKNIEDKGNMSCSHHSRSDYFIFWMKKKQRVDSGVLSKSRPRTVKWKAWAVHLESSPCTVMHGQFSHIFVWSCVLLK